MGISQLAQATTLTYVGVQTIATGTAVGGVEIGGLSGISYNPYTDRFIAVTDDSRSDGASRLWTLDLAYTGTAFSSATAVSSVGLKKPDGSTLPLSDTEGIAGNLDGSFYVSHEGLAAGGDPAYSIPPWISRFNGATGNKEADVALPVKFLPRDGSGNPVAPSASNQSSGVVSNLSLECLGITPAKKNLFTANEAALKQDYSGTYNSDTNQAQNSLTRIVRFTGAPGNPGAAEEKVYQADQGTLYIFVRRFNTVPEILPVDDSGRMLVMERGLTQNNTNLGSYRIRIYEVDFNQAGTTNVAGVNSLQGATYTRLSKTLRWESSSNMDNVESMCFGRDVNGFRTLVLASDNNFNGAQATQFHVLTTDIPAVTRRTLATAATGSGTVLAAPSVAWYPEGSEVTLTASPDANYSFSGWSGDASGATNPLVVVMDTNKSTQATFRSPFEGWQATYFTPGEAAGIGAPSSDPEGDGIPNLLEYALNLHPRQYSPGGLPTLGTEGGSVAGTTTLNGTNPWQSADDPNAFLLDGVSANRAGAALLPFTPIAGNLYTLTLGNITMTAGDPDHWIGLGFFDSAGIYGFLSSPNTPALLSRLNGTKEVWPNAAQFGGYGASGAAKIVLDTRPANWTVAFHANGAVTPFATYTYTNGNPSIRYVGMSNTGAAAGTVSAFTLTDTNGVIYQQSFSALSLTYRKDPSKPDIGWRVETSSNLVTWTPVSDRLVGNEGAIEIRQASVSIDGSPKFLRLKVTKLF
jgi:hypothetical protein